MVVRLVTAAAGAAARRAYRQAGVAAAATVAS
jgi:hypothetical protein